MKHTKSIIASVLVVSAVATTSVFAANSMGMSSKFSASHQKNPLTNEAVIKVLQEKGITAPTTEEMQAFEVKMKALRSGEKTLSDTDKASLKSLRDGFKKQERDFLRTKGVAVPTDEEIAKMELIRNTLQSIKGEFKNGSGSLAPQGWGKMGELREKMKEKHQNGNKKSESQGYKGMRGGPMGQKGDRSGNMLVPSTGTSATTPAPTLSN